jgi:hypothetical protein
MTRADRYLKWAATPAAVSLVFLIASDGAAQSPSPFQSAPGPEPVAKPPPHPQQPRVAPVPPPNDPLRWDGIWIGDYQCPADAKNPAYSVKQIMIKIKSGQVESRLNSPSDVPGTPGYQTWSGAIGPNGSVVIERTGIGTGRPAGSAPEGKIYREFIQGRFDGDNFVGRAETDRFCELRLTRVR